MGKTRPSKSTKAGSKAHKDRKTDSATLLEQAAASLQTGDPPTARTLASNALKLIPDSDQSRLPALNLLGEIYVELGEPTKAFEAYHEAVEIDRAIGSNREVLGTGPEKYFCLAQLSEEGGRESLEWYEEGLDILEATVRQLEGQKSQDAQLELEESRSKLAGALCGMVELWMTDLSFEAEAESQCDSLIARALLANPTPNASTLQTLASIRLSQQRLEDAQSALKRSLETWQSLPPEHPHVPDYPIRISLARLLMEAQMNEEALEVLERLVGEDDESVEAWYLGGWCLYLMSVKDEEEQKQATDGEMKDAGDEDEEEEDLVVLKLSSREWLRNSLKLYGLLQYEDERLRDHARELVAELDASLQDVEIEDEEGDEVEWDSDDEEEEGDSDNGVDEDGDQEMDTA